VTDQSTAIAEPAKCDNIASEQVRTEGAAEAFVARTAPLRDVVRVGGKADQMAVEPACGGGNDLGQRQLAAFETTSPECANERIDQLAVVARQREAAAPMSAELNCALAAVQAVEPENEIEAMLATEAFDCAETDLERALRRALAPLAIEAGHGMTDQPWVCGFVGAAPLTTEFIDALASARPFPNRLDGIWEEHRSWQALQTDRAARAPGYHLPPHVAARVSALELMMDIVADPSPSGIKARLAWLQHLAGIEHYRTNQEDVALSARIAADFDALMRSVQSGQRRAKPTQPRTQADRRRDVLSLLDSEPTLSDREIARRCDVSPQTVNNWRRRSTVRA
jgi:DNA-binding CsgD family transcriptional regulator